MLDGDKLYQFPFNIDILLEDELTFDGNVIVGSKERMVFGLSGETGEVSPLHMTHWFNLHLMNVKLQGG